MLTLPDVLAPDLDVVFCAPAVGQCAALRGHYYAGPGNAFWRLLHESGLTPKRLDPTDDDSLPAYGMGFVDVVRTSPPDRRPERSTLRHSCRRLGSAGRAGSRSTASTRQRSSRGRSVTDLRRWARCRGRSAGPRSSCFRAAAAPTNGASTTGAARGCPGGQSWLAELAHARADATQRPAPPRVRSTTNAR